MSTNDLIEIATRVIDGETYYAIYIAEELALEGTESSVASKVKDLGEGFLDKLGRVSSPKYFPISLTEFVKEDTPKNLPKKKSQRELAEDNRKFLESKRK